MSNRNSLVITSILFAVLWTAIMWWWNRPDLPGTIILAIVGGLAGLLWYWAMNRWSKRA